MTPTHEPLSDEEETTSSPPGMTVGQLRASLEGVPDDREVTIRTVEGFCGGITAAGLERDEDGELHFAIDSSDDNADFIDVEFA